MIQFLYSLFRSDLSAALTETQKHEVIKIRIFNYQISYRFLLILTAIWLSWEIYLYQTLAARPIVLFAPENFISEILMPSFPDWVLFHTVVLLSFCCVVFLFFYPNLVFAKFLLSFCCLWLNMAQWSWGFFSHVCHLFILSHLLSMFITTRFTSIKEAVDVYKTIVFFHFGILFTYLIAGVWKLGAVFYKIIAHPEQVTWLHFKGAWVNSLLSYRVNDYPIVNQLEIFNYPIFWQLGFVVIVAVQLTVTLAALKLKLQLPFVLLLFIFHYINSYAFCTIFIWQPLVLLTLFLPYHLLFGVGQDSLFFKNKIDRQYQE